MARRRYFNTAVLCLVILLFAFVLHRPLSSTHEAKPHRKPSTESIKLTVPTSLAKSREAILANDYGSISQVSVHNDYHELKPRINPRDVRDDWTTAVADGNHFFCFMGRTKEGAQAWINQTPALAEFLIESAYNDPQAIGNWGWGITTDVTDLPSPMTLRSELHKFMKELKLGPEIQTAWATHKWRHMKAWQVGTLKGPVSWLLHHIHSQCNRARC